MNRFIKTEHVPGKVILTDDPQRVRLMGSEHLKDRRTLFELRGMFGYQGTFQGVEVAVISCGFGESAALLYAEEAIKLGAEELIYLGECVSQREDIALLDVILVHGGDQKLAEKAGRAASFLKIGLKEENTLTFDTFWRNGPKPAGTEDAAIIDFAARGVYEATGAAGIPSSVILTVAENTATRVRVAESVRQRRFRESAGLAFNMLVEP